MPFNFVSIKNGHALVCTPGSVIAINLQYYFQNVLSIAEPDREEFDKLMAWMENKYFTNEFWTYLTGWNEVEVVSDDRILVKGDKFQKELIYEPVEVHLSDAFNALRICVRNQRNAIPVVGVSNLNLRLIHDTVGGIIGTNPLVFEFISNNSMMRFTADNMPFIFGVLLLSNNAAQRPYAFTQFQDFITNIPE